MLMDGDVAPGEGSAPAYLVDLQNQVLKADDVVAANRTLKLQREDQVQVAARAGRESGSALGSRSLKAAVEFRDIVLAQKAVGLRHRGDSAQAEFLRQSSLPGAEAALRAAPRLGRISWNHLHAQIAQRPPQLRHTMRVYLAAGLGRVPEMAAPVRIQGAKQALVLDHLPHRSHHCGRRFLV